MADANLPIDIHTNKLLDWLISRRHCKKDFQKALDEVRSRIRVSIQDMPQNDEVIQLLQENVFDYYVCKRVIEILKNTDKSQKNIFGQYTSRRLLEWQEIAKSFEKDNLYLAEDAQTLIRNVNYDVPYLKKLSAKYEQQISDCERMMEVCRKQSKNYENEYVSSAKKLCIDGVNIKEELASRLEILPLKMNELFEQLQLLIPVCDYYKTFVVFISQSAIECLPHLHYLLAKGNTTYFEFRTGTVPEVIENFKLGTLIVTDDKSSDDDNKIDFGDSIDFGDDNTSTDTPSTSNGDFVKLDTEEIESEINWDVAEVEVAETKNDNDGNNETRVARGEDAHSVLLNTQFRNEFINELIEIQSFLAERIHEMQSEHILSSYLFQSAPSVLQLTTIDNLESMHEQVSKIRESFELSSLKVLYYMKDSPKYIDNVYKKLMHLKTLSHNSLHKIDELDKKRALLYAQLSDNGPMITKLVERTKLLQQRIEESICKKYNNRPVNIMGGVQIL